MAAWHEVTGMRKRKQPVPEGRCDYGFARWSTKIVWACDRFRDGVDSGSYTIILSLRDGSVLFTPSNRSPFQGGFAGRTYPGLKPWAKIYNRCAVKSERLLG
jgi:hypothetical protein